MPDHFIILTCRSCGGKLEVFEDVDRFACAYCGTEMMVQRRGGTVALKMMQEAIHKVQLGTDKTAAELAMGRYQGEVNDLQNSMVEEEKRSSLGCGFGCAVLLVLAGGALVDTGIGAWILAIGLIGAGLTLVEERSRRRRNVSVVLRIEELQRLIAEKQRIADS